MVNKRLLGKRCGKVLVIFGDIRTDYNMEEVHFRESTQSGLPHHPKNKKIYYCDFFILSQLIEAANPPQNIETYELKDREVKFFRSKCDIETVEF